MRAGTPDYQRALRRRRRESGAVPIMGMQRHKPIQPPKSTLLDNAVTKVGQEFPSIGALVRLGWTANA